jgi:ABC-type branched-subunit amino acid transport system ATPase component
MMMAEPEMVLLDEPGSGVPPSLQNKVNNYVRNIRDEQGITFLVVEHDMNIIMDLCDPIIVLVDGEKLTEGKPEEIKSNEKVIEAYLGS